MVDMRSHSLFAEFAFDSDAYLRKLSGFDLGRFTRENEGVWQPLAWNYVMVGGGSQRR